MQDKAKAYSRERHRMAIASLTLQPVILFAFLALDIPLYFKNIAVSISPNVFIVLIIFSVLTGLAYYAANLPLEYYSGFLVEHRYHLSNQTLKGWLTRELKKIAITFIISLPVIISVYIFLKHWPLHWWLFTTVMWFMISVILAKFAPLIIVPLFYRYSPVKNPALKDRLIRLATKAGFRAEGVYEINMSRDTKKANAAVIGMGRQKRIVLCDTLIQGFTEPEIESVMGHELGHHKKRHNLKLILFGGISIGVTLFVTNALFLRLHDTLCRGNLLADPESIVLIYAIISALSIVTLPLHNAFSRKLEREADCFALEITGNKEAFISTMKKLASQNLADSAPGRFYEIILYSHPPISRRISFAESFGTEK